MAVFKRKNEIYIIRCEEKRLEFPDLVRYIKEFVKEYGYSSQSRIFVEPKASGLSVVQMIRESTNLNIIEDTPPDRDKITRLFSISPVAESRRLNLIQGGWIEPFLKQVCSISPDRQPPHDDMADVLIMSTNKLLIDNQFDFSFI